jgi:hypothetical protein
MIHFQAMLLQSKLLKKLFKISGEKQSEAAPTDISLPGVDKGIMTKFIHYIYQVPVPSYYTKYQCCGSESFLLRIRIRLFHEFWIRMRIRLSKSSGTGFRSDLKYLLFLKEYDFKGPKMSEIPVAF